MKKIILNIVLASLLSTSCSLLEEQTYTQFSENDFYQNDAQAQAALFGVYESLNDLAYRIQFLGNVGTDESRMYKGGTEFLPIDSYVITSSTLFLANFWGELYEGINVANDVINGVENSSLSDDIKTLYCSEARFLRALYYYYVVRVWGEAPLKLTPSIDLESSVYDKSSVSSIYDAILEDLNYAVDYLPVTPSMTGRVTKGAALAYIASVNLSMTGYPLYDTSRYQAAFDAAEDVVELETYSLLENYDDLFWYTENTAESIFEFQAGTVVGTGGAMKNYMGIVSTFPVVQHQDDPTLNCPDLRAGKDNIRPVRAFSDQTNWQTQKDSEDVDLRYNVAIAEYVLTGVDRNGARVVSSAGVSTIVDVIEEEISVSDDWTDVSISKFRFLPGTDVTAFTELDNPLNFVFMRYAEIYLILAEASYHLNKGIAKVQSYLQPIADRANVEVWDGTGDFTERILKERGWELCFEGKRYYDLKRLGKLVEYVSKRDVGYAVSGGYGDFNYAYINSSLIDMPIPQIESDYNDKIN